MTEFEQRDTFRLRVIVAKDPDNKHAQIITGVSDDTWEVIPPEEWDQEKRKIAEHWLGPDWTAYDFAEAVLQIPQDRLDALFSPPIPAEVLED